MHDYVWEALGQDGRLSKGVIAASSTADAVMQLKKLRLVPTKIALSTGDAEKPKTASTQRKLKGGKLKAQDVQAMTTELAIMIRAGLSLDNALRVLVDMSYKAESKVVMSEVLESVKAGVPLSQALSKYGELFDDFYINMVRSGEKSGQLSLVLDRLVEHLQRQQNLRDGVVSATIYPAILLAVAVISLVVMLGFVVPQFEELFSDMGDALPLATQIVMVIGKVFRENFLLLIIFSLLAFAACKKWLATEQGRLFLQCNLLRLPVLGPVIQKYQITLYARTLGTLLGNGVDLVSTLKIASDTVTNFVIKKKLESIVPAVKEGKRFAEVIKSTGEFEPLALNLVRVGEETGRLGEMMIELSNILNKEVENAIKRLLTMLEPLLILVLGFLIAAIIVSILLGILSVNDLAM